MRGKGFQTIFSRLMIIQCLTVALAVLLVGIVLMIVMHADRVTSFGSQLNRYAQIARERLADNGGEDDFWDKLAEENDLLIQLIESDRIVSYYADAHWQKTAEQPIADTAIARVRANASDVGDTMHGYFRKTEFPVLTCYCTIDERSSDGILLIHGDLTEIRKDTFELIPWAIMISALGLIASGIVTYHTSYRVIHPFIEMNHAVQCYSRGDFSTRIPVEGVDEAAQLGKSLNEMAEQLRGLEDTRRSFVANVSHELRSPLTSMKGFLEAMQDGTIPEENYSEYIGIVLNETRRMVTLVNDLLDLARIESGTIKLNYEVFDINELIRRTLLTFEARLVENDMEMDVRFAQEQCTVFADPAQIGQVLRNLIDNAIKYSPKGRALQISTYSMRKTVYVTVRDNGIGIPQEDVPHVFDRFYKVEKAHTPAPQMGSGLGLSIVKRIIEQHGQSITVRSARGKGTQFTFTLERSGGMKRVSDGGKRNVS